MTQSRDFYYYCQVFSTVRSARIVFFELRAVYLTPGICTAVIIMLVPPRTFSLPLSYLLLAPSRASYLFRSGCKVARAGLKPPALFTRGNKKPGYYYCYRCCYYRHY